MLDEFEAFIVALLGVPAAALVLWLIWSRLNSGGGFGFGRALLLSAIAAAGTGGAIWLAPGEVPLDGFGLGIALGFMLSALGLDYVFDWGPPIQPYALGCAPVTLGAAIVLGILLLGADLPPLGDAFLLGGLGGPAVALIATFAWLRWGPEGRLGCLPTLVIGAIAAIVVGGLEWFYHDEWTLPEMLVAVIVAGLLGLGVGGFLDRYRPAEEPLALGCLPPLGVVGVLAVVVALVVLGPPIGVPPDDGFAPTPSPTGSPTQTSTPAPTATTTPAVAPTASPTIAPTPSPTVTPTITPSPTPTPVPPAERTEFVDALIEYGIRGWESFVQAFGIPDLAGDLFKADGKPVDVANPADIQAGFVFRLPPLTQEAKNALFKNCGSTTGSFEQICGEQQAAEGPVNIIWIGMFEPFGEPNGVPVLFADHDTNTQNNAPPNSQFPLAPGQAADTVFQLALQNNRTVLKLYDFDRPGQQRRTDAVLLYGRQSAGWIVFGEYGTFTPLIEVFEGFPDDYSDDVLGPLPVAGEPFPAFMPYDVTQPCGGLCQP